MAIRVVLDPSAQVRLDQISDELANRAAAAIAADARRYAPVDTGALARGIEAEPAVGGTARVVANRNVPGDDPHVPTYVEMGTSKMSAQPYLRPAAYQRRSL